MRRHCRKYTHDSINQETVLSFEGLPRRSYRHQGCLSFVLTVKKQTHVPWCRMGSNGDFSTSTLDLLCHCVTPVSDATVPNPTKLGDWNTTICNPYQKRGRCWENGGKFTLTVRLERMCSGTALSTVVKHLSSARQASRCSSELSRPSVKGSTR